MLLSAGSHEGHTMNSYEILDHTADVLIRAYGKTLAEAFEHAAKAMFDIITDNSEIESMGQYTIELEAPNVDQLLVDWLSELLFLHWIRKTVDSPPMCLESNTISQSTRSVSKSKQ